MESMNFNFFNLPFIIVFLFFLHQKPAYSSLLFPKEALPNKSGYLPVNRSSESAIFYTFYEAQKPISSISQTPLLIWLQGGPGCSSMIGNFFELGPWRVNFNKKADEPLALEPNSGSWNRIFGLLFLDNPIGTGFSITAKPEEIPRDQNSVADHLFAAVSAFVKLNPSFRSRPLYITGESYAGKYVPSFGYYILNKNPHLPEISRLNLAGLAIGNGLTDPVTQVATHASHAYFSGLVNEKQRVELERAQLETVKFIENANWNEAENARNKILSLLRNMTGLATLYDYSKKAPYKDDMVDELLQIGEVKKALGAKESIVFQGCSDLVNGALHEDVMKSAKFMVDFVVEKKMKVLLYQGFFDLRDGVFSTEAWVKTLKWEGIGNFLSAERKVWEVNGELAGYVQKWGKLSNTVVLGAGHLVPSDQSINSQVMIEDWVLDKGLFANVDQ
ncbi:serine carboxypeptidase-like 50 [Ziziphus jujuba]|uniref:Carboxypeptidase n=1 Tax=Ziziphus jujuba TaxID=326968 RepID=A0A6P4AK78_ZIZJJ|nr:serine carboxypeptidase-like 50 [Ziziphus jujuba]